MAANDGERKAASPSAAAFRPSWRRRLWRRLWLRGTLQRDRRIELSERGAQQVKARGARERILFDEAADRRRHRGEFGVGEVDCRHGSALPRPPGAALYRGFWGHDKIGATAYVNVRFPRKSHSLASLHETRVVAFLGAYQSYRDLFLADRAYGSDQLQTLERAKRCDFVEGPIQLAAGEDQLLLGLIQMSDRKFVGKQNADARDASGSAIRSRQARSHPDAKRGIERRPESAAPICAGRRDAERRQATD